MNLEKVIFGFFVLLAATLNFGFFIGDISDPALHNVYELFARDGGQPDRDGAEVRRPDPDRRGAPGDQPGRRPATAGRGAGLGVRRARLPDGRDRLQSMASVVSLSGGALLANLVSVVLLVIETVSFHRRLSEVRRESTRCSVFWRRLFGRTTTGRHVPSLPADRRRSEIRRPRPIFLITAPDAGPADHADRDLRGERARTEADPRSGPGRAGRSGWGSSTRSTS